VACVAEPGRTVVLAGLSEKVSRVIEAAQQGMEFLESSIAYARRSRKRPASLDGRIRHDYDVSDLGVERNILRYRLVLATIRLASAFSTPNSLRTIAAAMLAGASLSISSAVPVAAGLLRLFGSGPAPPTSSPRRWRRMPAGMPACSPRSGRDGSVCSA
jgi:RHH-type proline utilization regulon transcriptional repressor/proline dehydrogenase/delta 1-pyrroline-5-carboxylate dehydrogenase